MWKAACLLAGNLCGLKPGCAVPSRKDGGLLLRLAAFAAAAEVVSKNSTSSLVRARAVNVSYSDPCVHCM